MLVDAQRVDEALPYLKHALACGPTTVPHVRALLGKVYAAQGRTDDAIAEYRQALPADRRGMYHYQLYRLYRTKGDMQAANQMLDRVREMASARER